MKHLLINTIIMTNMFLGIGLTQIFGQAASQPSTTTQPSPPSIEVVFVLDTTGSMGGLIHAAKEKIWAIANTLAMTKPAPDIKMGLVGYRDRTDKYVTKLTQMTNDLDAVYVELMNLKAGGGGDSPESVNQALHEAVTKIKWGDCKKTYRVIFLVGDYPPHMDYPDDVKYPQSCKLAAENNIVINTIQCGNNRNTEPIWNDIAKLAEGRYFRVEQSGSAILASTPFDTELAELSKMIDHTRIFYGSKEIIAEQEKRIKKSNSIYHEASASALAQRATFNNTKAGEDNFLGSQELIDDLANNRIKLKHLQKDQLPENMQKMSPTERVIFVADQTSKRKELQPKIKELAAKRQKHLGNEARKTQLQGKQSLDMAIFTCIKQQAEKKDIQYQDKPTY